jgi:hypothetical protein
MKIKLLPNERPLADLRRGLLQTITEEIVGRRTMVLTNKRLWLIHRRLFSYSTTVVFLKDITSIEARRTFSIAHCIGAAFSLLFALGGVIGSLALLADDGMRALGPAAAGAGSCGLPLLALGVYSALTVVSNSIFINTSMKPIEFQLGLSLSMQRIEVFVNRVQSTMAQYKA